MVLITTEDIDKLSLGSAVLGSGGGGETAYERIMAFNALEKYGPVELLSLESLKPDDFVVPFAFMGAPLVAFEKIPNYREFNDILKMIETDHKKKPTVLAAAEIGGSNALSPLIVAAQMRLPIVDADLMGRAFPQLQMCSPYLSGIPASPAYLADGIGNYVTVNTKDAFDVEKIARYITVAMGSHAALSMYLMNGTQAKQAMIAGSYTRALSIGQAIQDARAEGRSPVQSVLDYCDGVPLGQGIIVDVNQSVRHGFLEGTLTISTFEGSVIEIFYQGEYLLVRKNGKVIATTPDIFTLLESESGTPILSESLRYGLKVDLIALLSPDVWTTPNGTTLVGPRLFGHDEDYHPVKLKKKIHHKKDE